MGSGVELHRPKNMQEIAGTSRLSFSITTTDISNQLLFLVLSGMPTEHANRTVVIAPRELKTMQSGDANAYQWSITWKNRTRWTNPLMGWTSTADPMSNMKLLFDSKEDAIAYAEKNGWKMELRGPTAKVRTAQDGLDELQ